MPASQYETYRELILSGQIPENEIQAIFTDNPDFKVWYLNRAKAHAS